MTNRLHVGNLSASIIEDQLRDLLPVTATRINVVRNRATNRSRGFAFIELATEADTNDAATSLTGAVLDGRAISVSRAHPPKSAYGGFRRDNCPSPTTPGAS